MEYSCTQVRRAPSAPCAPSGAGEDRHQGRRDNETTGDAEDTESDNDADAEHKAADAADDELNAAKLLKNC